MMSIGKLAGGAGAGRYYIDQVAQGREDYYAGEGEAAGVWMGTGAALLGLSGEVGEQQLARLLEGRDPGSGLLLRPLRSSSPVAGFDLTLRAPKSVSVLFGVAEPEVAQRVVDAHEHAVAEAIGYLEREACWTRRGAGGAIRLPGRGFVAAAFRHRSSRAGDPRLHTHVVVANATQAGRRSLDRARRPRALPARQDRRFPLPGNVAGGALARARGALAAGRTRQG
jgi:conjugative relaxase-like TrwC/TraI family protein